ncbi:MFS transporter [Pseudomonas sp. 7P_10.2_Bac1]|uniref:MFS transporter n=1 Tax=Pseudomonas sp. 7P_10.2_Bac1 TaxID=2971614 RepID=UPI0021C8DA04|nr:MFS transporter [Pseudomonas sp. 7P_10.2_Bac1]MCU1726230.1 MFS transporter [Pseudomonas sp. 7P_10.2_Bac1]
MQNDIQEPTTHSWLGVLAIALGALSLVVTEFLPVGLLPGISRDLGISEGTAGLAVTATAILGFLAAPVTAIAIGRADRKRVLLGLTALLIVSSVLSWKAQDFTMLLLARALLGIGIGGFWAISITAAAKLVPVEKVHAASSLVFAGISIGSVIAVPAGSYIGAHSDWRQAFLGASVLAVLCFVLQLIFLPSLKMNESVLIRDFFSLLKSARIRAIFITVICIVAGQYAGYTFVTPYLEQITHLGTAIVSGLLLAYGVATVIGNFVGGALAGRNLHNTVVATVWIFVLSLASIAVFATSPFLAGIALLVWAVSWGMAPVGTQLWLFSATQHAAEAAQAMNTSVFQLSIGLGSLAGSIAVNNVGLHSSMWLATAIMTVAVLMVYIAGRMTQHPATA